MKNHNISIGCEYGDFPLGRGVPTPNNAEVEMPDDVKTIPDPVQFAFQQLDPIFEAGGKVDSIHVDGLIRRRLKGMQVHPNAQTLDEITKDMVRFWKKLHERYPDLKIGVITNFPNWDYTPELLGFNGHYTDKSGVTYHQAITALFEALKNAGERIDFLEVDCPYNYFRQKRTRIDDADLKNAEKILALQKWCDQRNIRFHMVINTEPGEEAGKSFHDGIISYIHDIRREGIFPDLFMIQSWYPKPAEHLPETQAYTFTYTAKQAITLIEKLYPKQE